MPGKTSRAGSPERVFFALWPPAEVAQSMVDHATVRHIGGQRVAPERLHLTIAFHGRCDLDTIELLKQKADTVALPVFELVLDRIGYFRRARVSWFAPATMPASLAALCAALAPEPRPGFENDSFRPHVSISRRSPPVAAGSIAPITWLVTALSLIASGHGGVPGAYRELARWPLATDPVIRARL